MGDLKWVVFWLGRVWRRGSGGREDGGGEGWEVSGCVGYEYEYGGLASEMEEEGMREGLGKGMDGIARLGVRLTLLRIWEAGLS